MEKKITNPELEKLVQTISSSSATTQEKLDIMNALIEYVSSGIE
jgi:hypothetical protein